MFGWRFRGRFYHTDGPVSSVDNKEDVSERDRDTIIRWNKEALDEGRPPLGMHSPAGWLWGTARLLDCVGAKRGRYARNVAETQAKKYADMWSQPLQLLKQRKIAG